MAVTVGASIAPGRTYVEAIEVLNTVDPTITGVPLVGGTVTLVLSASVAGAALPGCTFAATDQAATVVGADGVTREKYLATITGSATLAALVGMAGGSIYQYATVAGEPMESVSRLVDPAV